MNRQFIIKLLQAKQLEYEALKEIMPESMLVRIEKFEKELFELAKEYYINVFLNSSEGTDDSIGGVKKSSVRKVTIE
jgi:hypothetical protein